MTTVVLMSFHKFRKKWNLVFNHLNEKDFVQEQKRTNAVFNFLSRKEGNVSSLFPSRCWIFPIHGFPFSSKEEKIHNFLLSKLKWDKDTPLHFQKIWKYDLLSKIISKYEADLWIWSTKKIFWKGREIIFLVGSIKLTSVCRVDEYQMIKFIEISIKQCQILHR